MNTARTAQQTYLRTLIGIGAAMVFATLILRFGKALFLAPLNLTNENVVAAWFSGMLLLLGALHAADGYFRLRTHNLKAGLAWWVIAAMLIFLSADEIGSLHERMKDLMRMGPWLSFLPFLVVLLGGCVWSFVQLWVTPVGTPVRARPDRRVRHPRERGRAGVSGARVQVALVSLAISVGVRGGLRAYGHAHSHLHDAAELYGPVCQRSSGAGSSVLERADAALVLCDRRGGVGVAAGDAELATR